MSGKTLKDLEGWTSTMSVVGPLSGSQYALLRSPDRKRVAQVDMSDDEVSLIFNIEEGKLEYTHPKTALGMMHVGVTKEQLEHMFVEVYRDEKEEVG